MLSRYAEEEKVEQMNAQKRRMKMLEHRKAVERLIEERRIMIQKEKEAEIELKRREEELEKYKQQVIEQERRRLLLKHAKNLVGFLPKVCDPLLTVD